MGVAHLPITTIKEPEAQVVMDEGASAQMYIPWMKQMILPPTFPYTRRKTRAPMITWNPTSNRLHPITLIKTFTHNTKARETWKTQPHMGWA